MNFEHRSISNNERSFVIDSLANGLRVDGRELSEPRSLSLTFAENGNCQVCLGRTRVQCIISAEVVKPFEDRPTEGFYSFDVSFSPIASASFPRDGWTESSVEVCRVVERGLRESGAIDSESLCILAGAHAWKVRVVMHVLDHCGNLMDACSVAALAAMRHFRRPSVTIEDGEVKLYPFKERDPAPLAVHHMPVSVTFGLIELLGTDVVLVDPTDQEEAILQGTLSITVNAHGEICSVQKAGGCAVAPETMAMCVKQATVRVLKVIDLIEECVAKALTDAGLVAKLNLISYLEAPKDEEE